MRKQKVLAVITAMMMSVGVLFTTGISAKAEEGEMTLKEAKAAEIAEATEGDWDYFIDDGGMAYISRYNGKMTEVEIPAEIDGHKVIGTAHFDVFQDGIFGENSLVESIVIPEGVKYIGVRSLRSKSLIRVEIADNVTEIGGGAFADCTLLESVEIPDSVTKIGDSAFKGTKWLENRRKENPLVVVNGILIDGFTAEGVVRIPDSVTSISAYAFGGCSSLTSVNIPDSVTEIAYGAFWDCISLTSVKIPDSVTSIGDSTFESCISLTSMDIPNSVTSIGDFAFYSCSRFTSVNIPDSVEKIGDMAFWNCSSLTSVTIPDSVTEIGDHAFGYTYDSESQDNTKLSDFTIYGYADTAAEAYAKENGFTFIEIKDEPTDSVVTVGANGEFSPKLETSKDEALSAIAKQLTEEEIAAVKAGTSALDIKLAVAGIDDSVSEADKKLIAKAVESITDNDKLDFKVMNYLDIKLSALIDGRELAVTETDGLLTVSVALEKPANGIYKVIRIHDGKTDVIDSSISKDGKRLSFKTDKFSTYAIVYSDVASGDSSMTALTAMLFLLGFAGVAAGAAAFGVHKGCIKAAKQNGLK